MPPARPANTATSSSGGGTAAAAAATAREQQQQQQARPAAAATTIAAGLASPDSTQQAAAVNQLQTQLGGPALTAATITPELLSRGVHTRLLELLAASPDKGVRLLAARVLARWAAGSASSSSSSPLQEALLSSTQACQALWAVLEAFEAAQDAIAAALADPAAVRAAAVAVKRDAVDPDEWLPGPSKCLLEAVLRTLCSLAAADGSTADGSSCAAATTWLVRQPAATLMCLLRHTSSRIQMRAARLALLLARSGAWCEALATGGGLAVALRLAGIPAGGTSSAPVVANGAGSSSSSTSGGSPHVQLAALRLLRRLADSPSTAAGAVLAVSREPLLDRLVSLLVQQQQQPGAAGKAVGGAVNAAAFKTASADAARAGAQLSIQQAAADLLASLCAASITTSRRFVEQRGGGLEMLQALLPDAPSAPQADQQIEGAAHQQAPVAADAGGPPATTSNKQAGAHAPVSAAAGTCAVPPLALCGSEPGAPATQQPQPQHAPASSEAAAAQASTSRPGSPSPAAAAAGRHQSQAAALPKALNPELQAKLLEVAAAVLSHPDLVASLLDTGRASQLPRQLLHLFAAAAPAAAPAGACSSAPAGAVGSTTSRSGNGAPADAAGPATAASQATASKAGGPPTTSAGGSSSSSSAGGSKSSASPTPRGSSLAAKAALSVSTAGLQPEGCSSPQFAASAAAAATPRKAIAMLPPAPDPLAPPFPAGVKAPALACLAALAQHAAGATHLAAQRASSSSGGGPDACSMLCQVLLDVQQLCGGIQESGQVLLPRMLPAAAADLLAALAEHLQDTARLAQLPMLDTLKSLARVAEGSEGCASAAQTKAAVARALMLLPDVALVPPPRPPLPSPPPTPPPPPLPTSVAAWDALGRPCMTDGSIVVA